MILVIGSTQEQMVTSVYEELRRRGTPVTLIEPIYIPNSIRISFALGEGLDSSFIFSDGQELPLSQVTAIYQRVGFGDVQLFQEYDEAEAQFVNMECLATLNALLNTTSALVVNRPVASGSNASKPYQISLVQDYGFHVPNTLVTNQPDAAAAFYDAHGGKVIYKSISHVRSIVQFMKEEDVQRLDTLRHCPVQLQEKVAGFDVRVHVVGDAVFASHIAARSSDYRYDREAEITAWELPPHLIQPCRDVTRALGMTLSGIDLRITPDGHACCFEVNPSPAFTWYEQRTGQPITAALCEVLEGAAVGGRR